MVIPYVLNLGGDNVFLKDFFAKRLMLLFSSFFFVYLLIHICRQKRITLSKNIIVYSSVYLFILCKSFLNGNSFGLIITDAFIMSLPLFFYILIFKTSFDTISFKKNFLLYILFACSLVIFGVKLQFSYFSFLGIAYIIFLTKFNFKSFLLVLLLPILTINSLIGKSSLIMLVVIMIYFFLFDKNLVSKRKKLFLVLIPSFLIIFGLVVFWDIVKETGAYRNTTYFLTHTDFANLNFKDHSTGHRLFEAKRVLEEFSHSNWITKLFGNGFGSTIDLSGTMDSTIAKSNDNIAKVRHIHMGLFAVLFRYGIIGVILYVLFFKKMLIASISVLKHAKHFSLVLGALYLILIVFDSLISFPHMMSNFMFWFIAYIIMRENELIKANINEKNEVSRFKTI